MTEVPGVRDAATVAPEAKDAAGDEVFDTAWRADNDMRATLNLLDLAGDIGTTDDERRVESLSS